MTMHRIAIDRYKVAFTGSEHTAFVAQRFARGLDGLWESPSPGLGLTRDKMPQVEGEKTVAELLAGDVEERKKAEAMVAAGAARQSTETVLQHFLRHLEGSGIRVKETTVPVGRLRATQSEIKAEKVYHMVAQHQAGKFDNIDDSVVVSRDSYILDGHHRWAALVVIDPERLMNVVAVDLPIADLIRKAWSFPGVYRVSIEGKPVNTMQTRVASRHLARAYSPSDVSAIEGKFATAIDLFTRIPFSTTWVRLINTGRAVATWVVETRSIPRGNAKAVEMAARLFLTSQRQPRDHKAWWAKNEKYARLLLAAFKWPEKQEGGEGVQEKVAVGPFVMHNTLHLEDEKLQSTIAVVEKATARIRSSNSKLAKVLYGDVFVVGRIAQSKTRAWYYVNDDSLYLRLMTGLTEVRSLCHELGHRYYFKFLTEEQRKQWRKEFTAISYAPKGKVELPKVGGPLGIPVRGRSSMPIVKSYEFTPRGTHIITLEGGGEVSVDQIYKLLVQQAQHRKFPTPYASTNHEEYFAEAFADYVGGDLAPEHVRIFEEIVGI